MNIIIQYFIYSSYIFIKKNQVDIYLNVYLNFAHQILIIVLKLGLIKKCKLKIVNSLLSYKSFNISIKFIIKFLFKNKLS